MFTCICVTQWLDVTYVHMYLSIGHWWNLLEIINYNTYAYLHSIQLHSLQPSWHILQCCKMVSVGCHLVLQSMVVSDWHYPQMTKSTNMYNVILQTINVTAKVEVLWLQHNNMWPDLGKLTISTQQVKCILLLHFIDTLIHYQKHSGKITRDGQVCFSTQIFLVKHWEAITDGMGPLGGFNRTAWIQNIS